MSEKPVMKSDSYYKISSWIHMAIEDLEAASTRLKLAERENSKSKSSSLLIEPAFDKSLQELITDLRTLSLSIKFNKR